MSSIKVLQLCFVNNLWPPDYSVFSIDIQTGINILDLPLFFGQFFDVIVAAPPCDQFTKSNSLNWLDHPSYFIQVALRCFLICLFSGKPWILENPPGRILNFIPALKKYRVCTWHGNSTNKEYVVFSNQLFMFNPVIRYGKPSSVLNFSKSRREAWQPDFSDFVIENLSL